MRAARSTVAFLLPLLLLPACAQRDAQDNAPQPAPAAAPRPGAAPQVKITPCPFYDHEDTARLGRHLGLSVACFQVEYPATGDFRIVLGWDIYRNGKVQHKAAGAWTVRGPFKEKVAYSYRDASSDEGKPGLEFAYGNGGMLWRSFQPRPEHFDVASTIAIDKPVSAGLKQAVSVCGVAYDVKQGGPDSDRGVEGEAKGAKYAVVVTITVRKDTGRPGE